MRVRALSFALPKAGNTPDEYEDAFCPDELVDDDCVRFRCAVADGATETSFSGLWAQMLARSYIEGRLIRSRRQHTLALLRQEWRGEVVTRPLPWYAEEKARAGAFAALAGLTVGRVRGRRETEWRALAAGDCCIFHLRRGHQLQAFPLTTSTAFNSRPILVGSVEASMVASRRVWLEAGGSAQAGDRFYLMTDALACAVLKLQEAGADPWAEVDAVTACPEVGQFEDYVCRLRAAGLARNDDVTLTRAEVADTVTDGMADTPGL